MWLGLCGGQGVEIRVNLCVWFEILLFIVNGFWVMMCVIVKGKLDNLVFFSYFVVEYDFDGCKVKFDVNIGSLVNLWIIGLLQGF